MFKRNVLRTTLLDDAIKMHSAINQFRINKDCSAQEQMLNLDILMGQERMNKKLSRYWEDSRYIIKRCMFLKVYFLICSLYLSIKNICMYIQIYTLYTIQNILLNLCWEIHFKLDRVSKKVRGEKKLTQPTNISHFCELIHQTVLIFFFPTLSPEQ